MRDKAAGLLLLLMTCASLLSDIAGESLRGGFYLLAGVCSWVAAALLVIRVNRFQQLQAGVIGVAGLCLLALAWRTGSQIDIISAVSKNAALVAMIASVGFLRLIALSGQSTQSTPVGASAFFKTLFGLSVFGSVINISAPIFFADRLYAENRLGKLASSSFTRIFSGCSAWSPFFGGMAAVLLYVPEFSLGRVMMICFPFAVIGFAVVVAQAWWFNRDEVLRFHGCPVQFTSLWVPLALSVLVISLTTLLPQWSILTCISLGALMLTISVLLITLRTRGLTVLKQHVNNQLPRMGSELLLFLVAGVLAQGLASYLGSSNWLLPAISFGPLQATLLLALMIIAGIVGIHPVVTVAGLSPLLLTMNPDVHLLAVTYLFAWSLGTSASPLSGTHLVFQGRYGINSWKGAMWNWPYVAVMFFAAIPLLLLTSLI